MCIFNLKKKRKDIHRMKDIWNIWISKTYYRAYFKPVPVYRPHFSSFSCWHSVIRQSCYFAQGLMLSGPTAHPSPILPPVSSGGSFRCGNSLLPLPSSPTGCPWLQQGQLLHQSHTACNALSPHNSKINSNGLLPKETENMRLGFNTDLI